MDQEGAKLRFAASPFLRRFAVIVMMAAAGAFTLQGFFVATSEAATGDTSHYHHGFAFGHGEGAAHSHVTSHVHADGMAHRHALDDDDDEIDNHVKEIGWNMAIVLGVLPCPSIFTILAIRGSKLPIETSSPLRVGDQNGLRKPPRPPSMT